MTERFEISEAMIAAARAAGQASGVLAPGARHADVRRMLAVAVERLPVLDAAARYDLLVDTTITTKKARFLNALPQRCYYRVECEDGQILTVHGNDIRPGGRVTR